MALPAAFHFTINKTWAVGGCQGQRAQHRETHSVTAQCTDSEATCPAASSWVLALAFFNMRPPQVTYPLRASVSLSAEWVSESTCLRAVVRMKSVHVSAGNLGSAYSSFPTEPAAQ